MDATALTVLTGNNARWGTGGTAASLAGIKGAASNTTRPAAAAHNWQRAQVTMRTFAELSAQLEPAFRRPKRRHVLERHLR